MKALSFRSLAVCVALGVIGVSAHAAVALDTNLLANGGAEKGEASPNGYTVVPVPSWVSVGNFTVVAYDTPDFPTLTSPGAPKRGTKFFSGGPDNAESSASRTVKLGALAADIDTGTVQATLQAYLGGYASQEDHADLSATFYDAAGTALGTLALTTVTATDRASVSGVLKRKAVALVPAGSRSVKTNLVMTRLAGSYNDGYADALSLVLHKP